MASISDLMIEHPEMTSFAQLEKLVVDVAKSGEIHLYFDLKPEYPDTPPGWQTLLELTFYRAELQRAPE
ncbi:MAG: sulfur relay protein DsrC [Hyphomicrobiales bacterium]|nr:sulfur relay protein DsrC [Hyphomicrobiales bacterium]